MNPATERRGHLYMNPATEQKRRELLQFIQREVVTEPAVKGMVVVGSVAVGTARLDSDIDAFVFLEPFDLYAVPAEFQWRLEDGSFHPISVDVEGAIQCDLKRCDLAEWSKPTHEWPEAVCAELSTGWVAYDPDGRVERLVRERTAYSDEIRLARLDEALVQLDQLLDDSKAERAWITFGPANAHARLHAAWDFLMQAIFAYNRRWRTWRSRELPHLLRLPWLPENLEGQMLGAMNALSETETAYRRRLEVLQSLFDQVITKCQKDGLYGSDAISEAFIRRHDEPGRSWNIAEWHKSHTSRGKHPGGILSR